MYKLIALGGLIGASGEKFQKGFVRMPRLEGIDHEVTTEEMRQNAPSKLDWTSKGATTRIKDQGQCGSCWAYSTTETIESSFFMATGKLHELSEQQIISCDNGDGGCNGGDVPSACRYVMKEGGIELESTYPESSSHTGENGYCKSSRNKVVVKVTGYKFAIPECEYGSCRNQKESDIMPQLAKHGPLAICVNAESWSGYGGGILTHSCSGAYHDLDHCVQLVGYDAGYSTPYWKVRNSWGPDWGENGHIRLKMGENICGVASAVVIIQTSAASPYPPPVPPYPPPVPPFPPPVPPVPPPVPPPADNCESLAWDFCCKIGAKCLCYEPEHAPGQCNGHMTILGWEVTSYYYCCKFGTPCDCGSPPSDASNSILSSAKTVEVFV